MKSIINQVDGRIWFDLKVDKDTAFYVVLPPTGMKRKEGTKALG